MISLTSSEGRNGDAKRAEDLALSARFVIARARIEAGQGHGLGLCRSATAGWTANLSRGCDQEYRLYCLALDNGIFADGFESGDPTGWSNWVPQ